jgi:hypothetical protein
MTLPAGDFVSDQLVVEPLQTDSAERLHWAIAVWESRKGVIVQ